MLQWGRDTLRRLCIIAISLLQFSLQSLYASSFVDWSPIFAHLCLIARVFVLYLPIATERWLVKINRLFDHSIVSNLSDCFCRGTTHKPVSVVYAIVSIHRKDWYVGESGDFSTRVRQHITSTSHASLSHRADSLCHSVMSCTGAHDWLFIPPKFCDDTVFRKRMESLLIKAFSPPLNVRSRVKHSGRNYRQRPPVRLKAAQNMHRPPDLAAGPPSIAAVSLPSAVRVGKSTVYACSASHMSSHSFDILLGRLSREHQHQSYITVLTGDFDLTDWTIVRRKYGSSLVSPHPHPAPLSSIINHLKRHLVPSFSIKICPVVRSQCDRQLAVKNLQHCCLSSRFSDRQRIFSMSVDQLFASYFLSRRIQGFRPRSKVQSALRSTISSKIGGFRLPMLVVRVPVSPFVSLNTVRQATRLLLRSSSLHTDLSRYALNHIRVVSVSRPDLGSQIHNHIIFAKSFGANEPACVCGSLNDAHRCLRSPDVQHAVLRRLLAMNSKNVPWPSQYSGQAEVWKAVSDFCYQLVRVRKRSCFPFMSIRSAMCAVGVGTESQSHILNMLEHAIYPSQLTCQAEKVQFLNDAIIRDVKRSCSYKGWICSPVDHNAKSSVLICPVRLHQAMSRMFIADPHYASAVELPDRVICRWRCAFRTHGWSKVAPWHQNPCSLPYVYLLPKQKDLDRWRPIMSYCHHPMRKVMNVAARALAFCLSRAPQCYRHFSLHRTMDVCREINRAYSALKTGDQTVVYAFVGDVKNMFTELPHDDIRAACEFFIDITSRETRRDRVAVKRSGTKGVHLGRSYSSATVAEISWNTLREIIDFDLNNVFFTVGTNVRQQLKGVPMGGFLSAVYATCICAFYEIKFCATLGATESSSLHGSRYMDDLMALIASSPGAEGKARAIALWERLKSCYHEDMVVEDTATAANAFCYLEAEVELIGTTPTIKPMMKNLPPLLDSGRIVFPSLRHGDSFASFKSLQSGLTAAFHRLEQNSSSVGECFSSAVMKVLELRHLHYSKKLWLSAVRRLRVRGIYPLAWEYLIFVMQFSGVFWGCA